LKYGTWLRASSLKSRRRHVESDVLEETKLFSTFHKSRSQPIVRAKLLFDNLTHEAATIRNVGLDTADSSTMIIDTDVAVVVGNETFKRKQEDI